MQGAPGEYLYQPKFGKIQLSTVNTNLGLQKVPSLFIAFAFEFNEVAKDFKVELEVIVIGIGLLGFVVFGKREGVVNDGAAEEETSCAGEVFDFGELRGGGGGGRGGGGGGERVLCGSESGGGGKGFEVVVVVEAFESQGSLHFSVLVPSLCVCVCVSVCFGGGERGLRTMRNGSRKGDGCFLFFFK